MGSFSSFQLNRLVTQITRTITTPNSDELASFCVPSQYVCSCSVLSVLESSSKLGPTPNLCLSELPTRLKYTFALLTQE